MNIQGKLEYIKDAVTAIKNAILNKGVTPSGNLSTYADAIGNIDTTNNTTITINPTTSKQVKVPDEQYTGFGSVTVDAVTSSIDSNIKSENIVSGVNILGVTGSATGFAGETKGVTLTSTSQTFTPSSGKNGIISITVSANNQARTITPSTNQQTLSINSGYSGNGIITVNPVTSNIDGNITASNIKSGVTILGVTGGVTELKGETRTITANGTYTPSSGKNGITSVTVNVSNSIDELIDGSITSVDTTVSTIKPYAFSDCENLETVVLRNTSIVNLSDNTIFNNTPIENKTGNIYVPNNLLSTYVNTYNSISFIQGTTFSGKEWCGVAYGNEMFVAITKNGYVSVSDDGTTWSNPSQNTLLSNLSNAYGDLVGITYGNNMFVAITKKGYCAYLSDNSSNWNAYSNIGGMSNDYVKGIAYGNNKFIALISNDSGDFKTATKTLNYTWQNPALIESSNKNPECITYGDGYFMVVCLGGTTSGYYYVSSDGSTWTSNYSNNLKQKKWVGVASRGTKFVAISDTGYVVVMNNGTWSTPIQDTKLSNSSNSSLASDNTCFVASSTDGYITSSETKYIFKPIS